MTHFVFVRHGQTDWNIDNRFRGVMDVPLNDAGIVQVQRTGLRLQNVQIDAAYSSPLGRTRATAEIIASPHNLAVQMRPELLDLNYGDWTGKLPSEVDAAQYALWRTKPDEAQIPHGELLSVVRARAMALVWDLSAQHPNQTVLLVSHDLVGKILVCVVLDASINAIQRIQLDNASITRFDVENGVYRLVTVNESAQP